MHCLKKSQNTSSFIPSKLMWFSFWLVMLATDNFRVVTKITLPLTCVRLSEANSLSQRPLLSSHMSSRTSRNLLVKYFLISR
uniref:Uncharacterized protein n=1 Tax=Arundo donax TaxID=35708 RepID=A0A0A9AUM1_ARUDO